MTVVDASLLGGKVPPTKSAAPDWEREQRLQQLRSNIVGFAINELARMNGLPNSVSRVEFDRLTHEKWDDIKDQAIGMPGYTPTMAQFLDATEREKSGEQLIKLTVEYVGRALARKVKDEIVKVGYSPAALHDLAEAHPSGGRSVEDEALLRASDARQHELLGGLSKDARSVLLLGEAGWKTKEDQVSAGLSVRQVRRGRAELVALRSRLQGLASIFIGFMVSRRLVSPSKVEAAAITVGGAGVLKVGMGLAGAGAVVAALTTAVTVSLHAPKPPRPLRAHVVSSAAARPVAQAVHTTKLTSVRTHTAASSRVTSTTSSASKRERGATTSRKTSPTAAREFAIPRVASGAAAAAVSSTRTASPAVKEFAPKPAGKATQSPAAKEFK